MKRFALLTAALLTFGSTVFAQTGSISGTISDNTTSETIPFVNVTYAPGKGASTDLDGRFELKDLPYGTYTLTVSSIGHEKYTSKVVLDKKSVTKDIRLKPESKLIDEFRVVDYAEDRKTPVAKSDVPMETIQKELAGQDLPMVLNSTPGAYATAQGGGDGDARINIRGFSQRNVAVMIDGIPVNDMENGWVYWSNWFGLDVVTRTMQVQRGLGASKIAIPSVGGTINIMTQGIESKQNITFKQELGSGAFTRSTLGLTTGKMKNGWGITAAGSYKQGNGWVDQLYTKGAFYYLKVEKSIGNHIIGLSAMGAPQEHAQRSFKQNIPQWDSAFAVNQGIDSTYIAAQQEQFPNNTNLTQLRHPGYGMRHNAHWGYYEDYKVNAPGDTTHGSQRILNEKINYYHKPQFVLRDLWQVNDRLYVTNSLYLSIGTGGGTGTKGSIAITERDENGQIDWQPLYDANNGNSFRGGSNPFGNPVDPTYSDTENKSSRILYSSINNHFWYGLLSSFTFQQTDSIQWSGGLDMRSYRGQHYREVYNLIGGDYYIAPGDEYSRNEELDMLRVGDKFGYNNDGRVIWGGGYGQFEYTTHTISTFANISFALSGYKRIDYFKPRDIVIDDEVFREAAEFGGAFYYDANSGTGLSAFKGATITVSGDTTFINNVSNDDEDGYVLNAEEYTIDSDEARDAQSEWKYIPGFTIKTGLNYNLNEYNNVFFNIGYISKAQSFQNVLDRNNDVIQQAKNEKIYAFEAGFSRRKGKYLMNLNGYLTRWDNKPGVSTFVDPDDPDTRIPVSLLGMDAFHAGIEIETGYEINRNLEVQLIGSIGDWRWVSDGSFVVNSPENGEPIDTIQFDAKGIRVGDAAQTQFSGNLEWTFLRNKEKSRRAYLSGRYTYFGNHFSQFDPIDFRTDDQSLFEANFDADGNPRQSWKTPSYGLLDGHIGYSFKIKTMRLDVRGSVLNLLDIQYISDANNNDGFNSYAGLSNFDAASSAVFFGQGRRFNTSLRISF